LLAFAAGAAMVAAFAPLELWPLALAAPAALIALWRGAPGPRAAALIGFAFGLGLFGTGVSWVYVSLHRFGGMPELLAAVATLGFCAVLALYPAAVGWLQARIGGPARAGLAIPALWTLGEWLRAWVLTGFPWLATGYALVPTPLAGLAPVGGVHLLGLLAWLIAGLAVAGFALGWRQGLAALAAGGVLFVLGAALERVEWTEPAGKPVRASLLQGNIPQELKFDEARYARTVDTYVRLAEESDAQLVVLPETALPRFLDTVERSTLERLAAAGRRRGGDLLLGVPVREAGGRYYNSVVSLGASPAQRYDKVHLVPFGEFVPAGFGWVLAVLRIPLSDFAAGPARQPPLAVAGQRVGVSICYENAFGDEVLRQLPEATLLVNVSNVTWFGDSLAPAQHLQIAQLRAIETRRPMLTATNTGHTAAISHDGGTVSLRPFVEGKLEIEVQGRAGATPYVRLGDAAALALAVFMLAAAIGLARRR
jgi:apolipoprotein N-acyltransferase